MYKWFEILTILTVGLITVTIGNFDKVDDYLNDEDTTNTKEFTSFIEGVNTAYSYVKPVRDTFQTLTEPHMISLITEEKEEPILPEEIIEPVTVETGTSSTLPVITPIPEPEIEYVKSPTVLIVGDSMIEGEIGIQLEKSLLKFDGVKVNRYGKASTGLARPDYFDWNKKAEQLIKDNSSNVVVVMFGANDGQRMWTKDANFPYKQEKEWKEEYARRIKSFVEKCKENKVEKIYWIGNPIAKKDEYSERMQRINSVAEIVAEELQEMEFISTWETMKDNTGAYNDYLIFNEKKVKVRASDGIHLTPNGAKILLSKIENRFTFQIEKTGDKI